jgi:hypothetical protein
MPGSGGVSRLGLAMATLLAFASCGAPESVTLQLATLNESGVTGTVTLTDVGRNNTRVDVRVDPAGHPDMPAHIHPGSCTDLVPQPRYGLGNVVNGSSTTTVPASLADLFSGEFAVNLHASNDELEIYTACADLVRPPT